MRRCDKLFIVTCLVEVVAATKDEAEARAAEWCDRSRKTQRVTLASVADSLTDVLCDPDDDTALEQCLTCSARGQCRKPAEANHA